MHALQNSKCLPYSFSQVNWRNILGFFKTKHNLSSPFVVLSNHSVYVVFLDPHQGIDDFAFFLPTSKSLCGAQIGINIRTYLHCIYRKVKTRIQGEKCLTLRSRCACLWIYMVAIQILLCSLKTYLSCLKLRKLLQENMGYLVHLSFFRRASEYPLF